MFGLGYGEMLLFGFIAVLLFGKRLPEVAKSLGKGVTEFKKGVRGIEEGFHEEYEPPEHHELPRSTDIDAPSAPKFEPPELSATEQQDDSNAPSNAENSDNLSQDNVEPDNVEPDNVEPDNVEPDNVEQDRVEAK